MHTLFAREHNRIVGLLPTSLPEEEKFQIARRVVGAEEQYVTYQEFLPAMGVRLPPYRGYRPNVNATLSNEFATAGYRVHSMVHGEFEPERSPGSLSGKEVAAFATQGIEVEREEKSVKLAIPLGLTYGNPGWLRAVGLGPLLAGLGNERQYRNDEQIDESMRSILFQIPKPGAREPSSCALPAVKARCFSAVLDLGAIDIYRGRDHGLPSYDRLRAAYGLAPRRTYAEITGEGAEASGDVRRLAGRARVSIDDPSSLRFTRLEDADGRPVRPGTEDAREGVVSATRRTTLAFRLQAIYGPGNVDEVDAFVGMLAEPHVPGSELGELQLAIWRKQFQALRDGDRFFYLNDPYRDRVRDRYGLDYRQTLADIIRLNTGEVVQPNVFELPPDAE